jgi:predicted O-methyltransferase YrrM
VNTLNPDAEMKAATEPRTARDKANREAEAKRAETTTRATTPPALSPAKAGGSGTVQDADRARAAGGQPQNSNQAGGPQPPAQSGQQTVAQAGKSGTSKAKPKAQALTVEAEPRQPDVVFVPTPPEAIDTMLTLAAPRRGETLLDLGCGDGRIVVAAALRSGCRAIGYDIDPRRVAEARARIAAAGVRDLARVEQRDLFEVDLGAADVVTLYLLPTLNAKLIPQLQRLRPGARIVSHDFAIAGVTPDRVVQDYLPRLGMMKTYFLFTAPLRLDDTPVHQWRESARLPWESAAA